MRKTILKRLYKLVDVHPFSMDKNKKRRNIQAELKYLNNHHYKNCIHYKYILDAIDYDQIKTKRLEQHPFLHVDIFKKVILEVLKKEKYSKS